MSYKSKILELAELAGITIGKPGSGADIIVNKSRYYHRVFSGGPLAFGESYMDGDWDADRLDEVVEKILSSRVDEKISRLSMIWPMLLAKVANLQTIERAYEVGRVHYDIDYFLFQGMLDKRMTYGGGYWNDAAQNLDEAQEAKLDLVCRKIGLKAGDRVLDIGCGWGSFMKYAAENYGATVVGLTISKEQARMGSRNCAGLPVEFNLQDYRLYETQEKFDHVVSLDMFVHVGLKNHRTFMEKVASLIKDDGLFLLQTIGTKFNNDFPDPWFNKYIFPNYDPDQYVQYGQGGR